MRSSPLTVVVLLLLLVAYVVSPTTLSSASALATPAAPLNLTDVFKGTWLLSAAFGRPLHELSTSVPPLSSSSSPRSVSPSSAALSSRSRTTLPEHRSSSFAESGILDVSDPTQTQQTDSHRWPAGSLHHLFRRASGDLVMELRSAPVPFSQSPNATAAPPLPGEEDQHEQRDSRSLEVLNGELLLRDGFYSNSEHSGLRVQGFHRLRTGRVFLIGTTPPRIPGPSWLSAFEFHLPPADDDALLSSISSSTSTNAPTAAYSSTSSSSDTDPVATRPSLDIFSPLAIAQVWRERHHQQQNSQEQPNSQEHQEQPAPYGSRPLRWGEGVSTRWGDAEWARWRHGWVDDDPVLSAALEQSSPAALFAFRSPLWLRELDLLSPGPHCYVRALLHADEQPAAYGQTPSRPHRLSRHWDQRPIRVRGLLESFCVSAGSSRHHTAPEERTADAAHHGGEPVSESSSEKLPSTADTRAENLAEPSHDREHSLEQKPAEELTGESVHPHSAEERSGTRLLGSKEADKDLEQVEEEEEEEEDLKVDRRSNNNSMNNLQWVEVERLEVQARPMALERYHRKAMHYVSMVSVVSLLEVWLVARQMDHSSSVARTAKMSLSFVAQNAIIDSYLSLVHLTTGVVVAPVFAAFAAAAFIKFAAFAVFWMRYLFGVWRARAQPSLGETAIRRGLAIFYLRFYAALMLSFVVLYVLIPQVNVLVLALYGFWMPQIVSNVQQGTRFAVDRVSLYGLSCTRLVIPLYFYWCRYNFLHVETSPRFGLLLCAWMLAQVLMLVAQDRYGPRFFLPRAWFPPAYDYWSREHAPGADAHCVICMSALLPSDRYMTTPCAHTFHESCLLPWLDEKLECPACRAPLEAVS